MIGTPGPDFSKMAPGMDFLQGLMQGAGQMMNPGANTPASAASQWLMPTMDLEELDKRIRDLKTVQFWLEQNARLLASTIQTLEVQRMTVATLKDMNVSMKDVLGPWATAAATGAASASHAAAPAPAPAPRAMWPHAPVAQPAAPSAPVSPAEPVAPPEAEASSASPAAAATGAAAGAPEADVAQWWNQLTRQFGEIASVAAQAVPANLQQAGAELAAAAASVAGSDVFGMALPKAVGEMASPKTPKTAAKSARSAGGKAAAGAVKSSEAASTRGTSARKPRAAKPPAAT